MDWFCVSTKANESDLKVSFEFFEKGDANNISEYLRERLARTISYYDEKDSFYNVFLVGLLTPNPDWNVSSNDEVGDGRADIIVENADGKFGFVIELKAIKDLDKLDATCDKAMRQIEEKDYSFGLRESRAKKIFTYAITFCGKRCKVTTKEVI